MEVSFTEEQEMLRKSASDFLAKECDKEKVRELEEDEKGYSPEIWKKMAELGWLGLIIPEEYGGMGMTFQDLTIVLEEMGKNIFPGPFFCTMTGGVIPLLIAGSEEQKKEFLPKIASGDLIFTLALLEDEGIYEASGITTKATAEDEGFVIDGTKLFVEKAHIADYLICAAKTTEEEAPEEGITLFIVDAEASGVHCEVMPTMAMDKLCEVRFEEVAVPEENILGELDEGWPLMEKIIEKGSIAKCAESVGGMQACVDMSVEYSKERIQYEVPIGAFQVLQHWMADMWIALQTSKYLVYEAAWMESEGLSCSKEISMAKAYVNEKYKWVSDRTVQLHGGVGTSREYDPGLYYRRAKAADIAFGGTGYHRDLVADEIGLLK